MTEPVPSSEHPDFRIVPEAVHRGWLEVSDASQVIGILIRSHASGDPFDLDAWLLQNNRLSKPQLQELRNLPPTLPPEDPSTAATVLETNSPLLDPVLAAGPTRVEQLDQSIRNMWTKESPSHQLSTLPPLPDKFQRYTDFKIIGSGGMGQILRATDPKLERQIAIKTLHPKLLSDDSTLERFQREARITGQLEHPNIIPIHDVGQNDEGVHFFCMKLVSGQSLAEVLSDLGSLNQQRNRPHDGTRLLPDFIKICDALQFAHSRGVIHRDLKPDNVMIGSFGEVLVMDWGLAKRSDSDSGVLPLIGPKNASEVLGEKHESFFSSLMATDPGMTHEGTVLGTPIYMSPEQAEGKIEAIDAQSDLYSLGAILYQILSLRVPFQGSDTMQILSQVLMGKLVPPSQRAPSAYIPRDLEAVVLKAMARDKVDRYPNVNAFKTDLESYLEGRTLGAAHYSFFQRLTKWVKRNRTVCTAVAVMTFAATGLFTFLSWRNHQERAERFATALHNAEQLRQAIGDIAPLTVSRPRVDPTTGVERRDTPQERMERKEAIRSYVAAARALDRALHIHPQDPQAKNQRLVVGRAIGDMALQGRDYLLARQAYLQLDGLGIAEETIDNLVEQVDTEERSILELRKTRLETILADFSQGLAREGRPGGAPLLPDYVFEAVGYRDHQTVEILGRNLDTLTEKAAQKGPSTVWTQPERDRATFICRVLARLGLPESVAPLGRWMAAVTDQELAVEAGWALCNTRHPDAQPHLIQAKQRLGSASEAWKQIKTVYQRIPEPPGAQAPTTYDEFRHRGRLQIEKKRYHEAIDSFTQAIRLEPDRSTAYLGRGDAHQAQTEYRAAIADFTRAIELHPTSYAYRNRGRCHNFLGNLDAAISDYTQAIHIDPDDATAHVNRGRAHKAQGNRGAAMADYNRAIEIQPDHALVYNTRGIVWMSAGKLDAAIDDFDKAIDIDPKYVRALVNRGTARLQKKDLDAAIADYNRAIEIDPKYSRSYHHRGQAYLARKDLDTAIADFRQALLLSPRLWNAWRGLGESLIRNGQHSEGIDALHKAMDLAPSRMKTSIARQIRQLGGER